MKQHNRNKTKKPLHHDNPHSLVRIEGRFLEDKPRKYKKYFHWGDYTVRHQ